MKKSRCMLITAIWRHSTNWVLLSLTPFQRNCPHLNPFSRHAPHLSHNRIREKKTYIFFRKEKKKNKNRADQESCPFRPSLCRQRKTHHWGIVYEHVHTYTYMYKFKEDFYLRGWRGSWCIGAERGCKGREVAYIKVFLILYGKLVKIACSFTEMPPNW